MMLTIASCLEVLERRRDLIAAAISSLRALEAADNPALALAREELQKPATPATAKPQAFTLQRPAPVPKTARAGSSAATVAPKDDGARRTSSGARLVGDAVLQFLLKAREPQRSTFIAEQLGRAYSAVNYALVGLERSGHVVRSGNGNRTRWSLPTPKADAAQPVQPTAPRNGAKTVRADGVEFETVFDGGRGQSLTGDRPSKGSGVPNV